MQRGSSALRAGASVARMCRRHLSCVRSAVKTQSDAWFGEKMSYTEEIWQEKKKSQVNNIKKRPAVETEEIARDPERNAGADGTADAPDSQIGLAAPTARPGPSQRVRLDTAMLQPSEVREKRAKADKRLQDLAAKPAMKRKLDCSF